MPKFYLRSLMSQSLIDSDDYEVEAADLDAARARLAELQDKAQDDDTYVNADDVRRVYRSMSPDKPVIWKTSTLTDGTFTCSPVSPLDPSEVMDGDRWIVQLDATTGEQILEEADDSARPFFSKPELATILAALRFWQASKLGTIHVPVKQTLDIQNLADDDGSMNALDSEDIDALCERLNTLPGLESTTRLFLDISTAHLDPESKEWLEFRKADASAYEGCYGWFVHAGGDPYRPGQMIEDESRPPVLAAVFKYAISAGCDYVLFDADAEAICDLPEFDDDGRLIADETGVDDANATAPGHPEF